MSRTGISQQANLSGGSETSSKAGTSGAASMIDARPQATVQRQIQTMADGSVNANFEDNRPAAVAQREVQELADSAPRVARQEAVIGQRLNVPVQCQASSGKASNPCPE